MSVLFYIISGASFSLGLYIVHGLKAPEYGWKAMRVSALFAIAGGVA